MTSKIIIHAAFFFLAANVSYAKDANVCATLTDVVSMNQDRFDQAKTANENTMAICKDEPAPSTCALDIKNEYEDAFKSLEKSKNDYKRAGCEEDFSDVSAQVKFLIKDGKKIFSAQNFPKNNLYILNFGFEWANFDSSVHSGGYNFAKSAGLQFISPNMPKNCFISNSLTVKNPVAGFLNGVAGGTGSLQIALSGLSCAQYINSLNSENLIIAFKEIQSIQSGTSLTPVLKLEVLDLP